MRRKLIFTFTMLAACSRPEEPKKTEGFKHHCETMCKLSYGCGCGCGCDVPRCRRTVGAGASTTHPREKTLALRMVTRACFRDAEN
jgi:hypothetical protein